MKNLLSFILLQFVSIADGQLREKMVSSTIIASLLAPILFILEKLEVWTIENSSYLSIVCGAILTDWIFGTIKHTFFTRTFSWKDNATGLTTKILLVVFGVFLFESLNFILKDLSIIEQTLKIITRLVVFIYPATSAWNNMSIVSNGKFPPKKWLEKIYNFNETLDINQFKNKSNDQ